MKNLLLVILGLIGIAMFGYWFVFSDDSRETDSTNNSTTDQDSEEQASAPQPTPVPTKLPPLTMEMFFDEGLDYLSDTDTLLMVTGDVMVGRMINKNSVESNNFNWAYTNIPNFFDPNAITFINLENPLVEDCPVTMSGMIFCGDLRHAEYLFKNNIDIVSLANNHTLNHGSDGLNQTMKALDDAKVKYTGVENPTIVEHNGNKIVFLGFDHLECNPNYIECIDPENIVNDIKEAKKIPNAFVVAMFHWGQEYQETAHEGQIELAHLAIDSGADLILGNHPHWYQNLEIYKNKLIAYSHGNFIFDQMWSEETKEGIVGKYIISNGQIKDAEFVPIYIENFGQPEIADPQRMQKISDNLYNISK